MAKRKRKQTEKWVDPDYSFRTERNEKGEIVYFVPVEATSPDALITLNARENGGTKLLRFGAGQVLPVVFIRTTNAEFARDQRSWLNRMHSAELRWRKRAVYLDGFCNQETEEAVLQVEGRWTEKEYDGLVEAEYGDLPSLVADYIDSRHPRNPVFRKVYMLMQKGFGLTDIAQLLDLSPQLADYYRKVVLEEAARYKRKFLPG